MGMEQKTIGRIFFAETLIMGIVSIVIGIFLGVFCSQFITAMLLSAYGKPYELSWTFPRICFMDSGIFCIQFSWWWESSIRARSRRQKSSICFPQRKRTNPN